MNFPNLPTDNLYKFIALAGVLIGVLSAMSVVTLKQDRLSELVTQVGQLRIADAEIKSLREDVDDAKLSSAPTRARVDNLKLRLDAIDLESAKTQAAMDRSDVLFENRKANVDLFGMTGVYLGEFMTVLGFLLWYFKLQRHQDRMLRAQVQALLETPSSTRVSPRQGRRNPSSWR